jgi:hypothetical protein
MMTRTRELRFVKRKAGKEVQRVLQQCWIDDDPPDEGAPKRVWRDIPTVEEEG